MTSVCKLSGLVDGASWAVLLSEDFVDPNQTSPAGLRRKRCFNLSPARSHSSPRSAADARQQRRAPKSPKLFWVFGPGLGLDLEDCMAPASWETLRWRFSWKAS